MKNQDFTTIDGHALAGVSGGWQWGSLAKAALQGAASAKPEEIGKGGLLRGALRGVLGGLAGGGSEKA